MNSLSGCIAVSKDPSFMLGCPKLVCSFLMASSLDLDTDASAGTDAASAGGSATSTPGIVLRPGIQLLLEYQLLLLVQKSPSASVFG